MMRRLACFLTALGLALLAASVGLCARNRVEDLRAGHASARLLSVLEGSVPAEPSSPESGDTACIGILTIPGLSLELPILARWSDENLKTAPCRYSGSADGDDLVLLAHNYRRHFGPIRRLKPGDRVVFEVLDGSVHEYRVTATDVVHPAALEEVTSGVHALTLITCTYGGQARVVVRCDRVSSDTASNRPEPGQASENSYAEI